MHETMNIKCVTRMEIVWMQSTLTFKFSDPLN